MAYINTTNKYYINCNNLNIVKIKLYLLNQHIKNRFVLITIVWQNKQIRQDVNSELTTPNKAGFF